MKKFIYGMPSYGADSTEITEIGDIYGEFYDVQPETISKATGYEDCTHKEMYVGDVVRYTKEDGQTDILEVVETTLNMQVARGNTVRLKGVIAFKAEGETILVPGAYADGTDDTKNMKIIGNVWTK